MDNSIKERWITALRSGEYSQDKEKLAIHSEDDQVGFCCLGVLCELAVADKVIDAPTVSDGVNWYAGDDSVLPYTVISWAELEDEIPDFYMEPNDMPECISQHERDKFSTNAEGYYYVNLAELNDKGATFLEIADLIEKYL